MRSASPLSARLAGMLADRAILCALLAAFVIGPGLWNCQAMAADALSSPWSPSAKSAARLIASGSFEGGVYRAAVEIKLNRGTLTYWRTPGDGGVPPVFAFDGSLNLAKAEVRFPAPTRYSEAGLETFGYKDSVIFPVDVTPKDARSPVEIVLDLRYATCDEICLPAAAKISLALQPQQEPGPEAALVAAARAQVPKIITAQDGPGFSVTPVAGTASPTWVVHFSPSPNAAADLFAEGPEDYFFDTAPADNFKLVLVQAPSDAKGLVPVTLTLVDGRNAYQATISLDVTPPTP
jgi:DsbC/DsbD-like thiol-disulfide interchange protein